MDENGIEIIENTTEARKDYGYRYGGMDLELTAEHLAALRAGKCLATNDGEYSTFITLEKKV